MHNPARLQEILMAPNFAEFELTFRPMFGGIMGYSAGRVFASLSDIGLALKFNGKGHEELLSLQGFKPLQYEQDKPPSKTYVVIPDTMLSEPDKLKLWIARSLSTLPSKSVRK